MSDEGRYGIEELAALGGVTRRTVRFYVQEGLLPAPLGVGRGRHYGPEHLERLRAVKGLQERGLRLDEVRAELAGATGRRKVAAAGVVAPADPVTRSAWTRMEIVPGVEIHLSGRRRLPSARELRELVAWCEEHFRNRDQE